MPVHGDCDRPLDGAWLTLGRSAEIELEAHVHIGRMGTLEPVDLDVFGFGVADVY